MPVTNIIWSRVGVGKSVLSEIFHGVLQNLIFERQLSYECKSRHW